jgi:2-polyprenyl-3-methyl-5-hydroxy-6-metoxy-1,4-benzoquinol methylase
MNMAEIDRLQQISQQSLYSQGVMVTAIRHCHAVLRRWLRGGPVLEMGPAEGVMTERLVQDTADLTVVEGSALFCEQLRARFPTVAVHHALFESFETERRFQTIVLGHVLEHVEDPVAVLQRVACWLAPEGRIFAAVPNARSLHRQAAVNMGLLAQEDALNTLDLHHGHRRVFSPETLRAAFTQAGLGIEAFGGYWLKPLSNGQLEASWTQPMLDAYMALGERYPDIAAEIYVVAGARAAA